MEPVAVSVLVVKCMLVLPAQLSSLNAAINVDEVLSRMLYMTGAVWVRAIHIETLAPCEQTQTLALA